MTLADQEPTDDAPGYAEALDELEGILGELEGDDLDVDVLAAKVRRAAELLAVCRDRLGRARAEVEQVVVVLDDDSNASPPPDAADDLRS